MAPTRKKDLAQSVSSAKAEKPWVKGRVRMEMGSQEKEAISGAYLPLSRLENRTGEGEEFPFQPEYTQILAEKYSFVYIYLYSSMYHIVL